MLLMVFFNFNYYFIYFYKLIFLAYSIFSVKKKYCFHYNFWFFSLTIVSSCYIIINLETIICIHLFHCSPKCIKLPIAFHYLQYFWVFPTDSNYFEHTITLIHLSSAPCAINLYNCFGYRLNFSLYCM